MEQLPKKIIWTLHKKIKNTVLYDPAVTLLDIYIPPPKKMKSRNQTDICIRMFIAALITVAKGWKQPKHPSTGQSISQTRYICTHKYYSAINNEGNSNTCYSVDEPRQCCAKRNKPNTV